MITEFEQRAEILGELHARPFEKILVPRRVFLMTFLTDHGEALLDRENLETLCKAHAAQPPLSDANFLSIEIGQWHFRWEQHNEFTTYRWDIEDSDDATFRGDDGARLLAELNFVPPGRLIVATQLKVTDKQHSVEELEKIFNPSSLCAISTDRGKGHVATDFQVDAMGFTRFLVEDLGMSSFRLGGLVQRTLEVETYRTLALLGLPVAKKSVKVVNRVQDELSRLTGEIANAERIEDNGALLKDLTDLAAELEAEAARTAFRFGASIAYHNIVNARLANMREESIEGARRFSSFFKRRLDPAIATCSSVQERQSRLSQKLARTAELLRTRVQFELEEQNRNLLQSMDQRAQMQLRLQQTVEGLSVAAMSYYTVGLIAYLAKGMHKIGIGVDFNPTVVTALSVPIVVVTMWVIMRRIHRSISR